MTHLFRTWVDLPPRVLHPNNKVASVGAARARADAAGAYKCHVADRVAIVLLPDQRLFMWHDCEARLTFHFPTRARRDTDNLDSWFKYGWDGLVLGGLLIDDDRIVKHPTRIVIDPEDYEGTVCVEVWPVKGTADSL